jgi:hypothetical protein
VKAPDSIRGGHSILLGLRAGEGSGILGVVVICVDIERNTSGEGGFLARF